jgi:signal transduction histidine kinase
MNQALFKGPQAPRPDASETARPLEQSGDLGPLVPGADAAPRSFLRMVSHELRTPLNAIIGFSEIISAEMCGPVPAQYREYGEIIRVSGHRLLRLVNQVIDIVRLESGQVDLDPRAEPVDAMLGEAARACTEELEARRLKVVVDTPKPVPSALADARTMRTALICLIQNAATYAPEGSTIRLTGKAQGPLVELTVADEGEGLDPNEIPRLLAPFEQGDNALARRVEGAGLGWPLVKLTARAHGGRFWVDTAPGKGLRATLVLRRAG